MASTIFVKNEDGTEIDFNVAVVLMDDDIREQIHNENPNLTPQEFYDEYVSRHYEEFDEWFTI